MHKLTDLFRSLVPVALALVVVACHPDAHHEEFTIEDPVSELHVDLGAGDIQVVGADVEEIRVAASVTGSSNHLGHEITHGRLRLYNDCVSQSECGADVLVTMPAQATLNLKTGAGDVAMTSMQGDCSVR